MPDSEKDLISKENIEASLNYWCNLDEEEIKLEIEADKVLKEMKKEKNFYFDITKDSLEFNRKNRKRILNKISIKSFKKNS